MSGLGFESEGAVTYRCRDVGLTLSPEAFTLRVTCGIGACLVLLLMIVPMAAQTPLASHNAVVGGTTLHYLEAGASKSTSVLLLHGGRFTSETWRKLGTITSLVNAGHHVIALDLPGYGDSEASTIPRNDYLHHTLETLWPTSRFLMVSPSMSGGFSLPLVARHPERVAGYIPIAPVGINSHLESLRQVDVPTLVMWGEDDQVIPVSQASILAQALSGETLILAGASHAWYLDRPDEFHRMLLDFVTKAIRVGGR